MKKENAHEDSVDMGSLGLFLGGLGGVLVVIKYFPPLFIGALLGLSFWIGTITGSWRLRILRPVLGLSTLAATLFALVGSPLPSPSRITGFLGGRDFFHDFMRYIAGRWNQQWPKELHFMWFKKASTLDVSQWFWLSFATAVLVLALFIAARLSLNWKWEPDPSLLRLVEVPISPWLKIFERLEKRRQDPASGFPLGVDAEGTPFVLTERNLGYHTQLVAPKGGGKTNLIKLLIRNRVRLGHGLVLLDYKGDSELMKWVVAEAEASSRRDDFRLISLAEPELSVPYNPLGSKDPIELHSQLMNSMTWSEEFYRKVASTALIVVLSALTDHERKTGERFHFGTLLELLRDEEKLYEFVSRANEINPDGAADVERLSEEFSRASFREKVMGLIASLTLIRSSSAGKLMTVDVESGAFSIEEAMDEGRIAFFSINSLKLKESATVLGRLILQDLLQQIGRRYDRGGSFRPVTVIIDEFASFAVPEFIEFLDRARGASVSIVIAHQSRADLDQISPEFKTRVEANMNTSIVSGVRDPEEAEHFAGMLGTRTTTSETVQKVRSGFIEEETGVRSSRAVEEFLVHPNQLKALNQGQVLVVCRTVDPKWSIVRVPIAPTHAVPSPDLLAKHLQATRQTYRSGTQRFLKFGTENKVRSTDCASVTKTKAASEALR